MFTVNVISINFSIYAFRTCERFRPLKPDSIHHFLHFKMPVSSPINMPGIHMKKTHQDFVIRVLVCDNFDL